MKLKTLLLITTSVLFMLSTEAQTSNSYEVIYEADSIGNRISGNLEKLVEYVRKGSPVRVGWEIHVEGINTPSYTLEHWTDASFTTIFKKHVFAQVSSIYAQGHFEPEENSKPEMYLVNGAPNGWVAILGTNGILNQKFKTDEEWVKTLLKSMTQEEVDKMFKSKEKLRVKTKWSVLIQ